MAGQIKWGFLRSTASSFMPTWKQFLSGAGGSCWETVRGKNRGSGIKSAGASDSTFIYTQEQCSDCDYGSYLVKINGEQS